MFLLCFSSAFDVNFNCHLTLFSNLYIQYTLRALGCQVKTLEKNPVFSTTYKFFSYFLLVNSLSTRSYATITSIILQPIGPISTKQHIILLIDASFLILNALHTDSTIKNHTIDTNTKIVVMPIISILVFIKSQISLQMYYEPILHLNPILTHLISFLTS